MRGDDGDPVVLKNAPLLDDGTPMPTRYWLIGPDEVRRVSQLEASGGVRAAEAAIDAALIDDAHHRYAAERDAFGARRPCRPAAQSAGSAAREPASSASTPTTHGTSRAVTTRSAAGSASSSSVRRSFASRSANRRRRSRRERGRSGRHTVDDGTTVGRGQPHGDRVRTHRPAIARPAHQRARPRRRRVRRRGSEPSRADRHRHRDVQRAAGDHAGPPRSRQGRTFPNDSSCPAKLPRRSSERSPPRPRATGPTTPDSRSTTSTPSSPRAASSLTVMRRLHLDQVTIA